MEENLLELTRELAERTYRPSPSFCFVAKNDKHREVFAANFRDRVVHHLLVRQLEKIWEPIFIHDSYACRKGKGTHAAVSRLQSFMRKVTNNNTRRAWFAKLDIKAFFPSIDRRLLLKMLLAKLENEEMRRLSEVIVLHDPSTDPVLTCSPHKWRNVPDHKSLFCVPEGKGLPIGNLTSQFFANVYLDKLDQFVKHGLKAKHYIRYVDDFILLHEELDQLTEWRDRISDFLAMELKLTLHPRRQIIRPVSNGIDFLGYVIRPTHLLVRRRTAQNCKKKLADFENQMLLKGPDCTIVRFPLQKTEKIRATLNSYLGAFSHASSLRLVESLFVRFPFLRLLFRRRNRCVSLRWNMPFQARNLFTQYRFFRSLFQGIVAIQVGCFLEFFNNDARLIAGKCSLALVRPRPGFQARCGIHIRAFRRCANKIDDDLLVVTQTVQSHGRLRERTGSWMKIDIGY